MATGDIYEDIPQAQAAAREGADVIAVIRSTGQSLLDYVPEGATREGFAGTYATQENFRLMRAALDESSEELGRYVRLTNYASGLCMPEIAALAGLERLDMMLNDSMYGILFRDINPIRTFVDQRFSRQVHARAGIIINTGEDNYLTTADAVEAAHTVTRQPAAQRVLRQGGRARGLAARPRATPSRSTRTLPDSFRLELAHALLARELFPDAPLKWMPPTRHMTGDVFRGYLLDGFFNLVGALTGQGILLVGMMTEAVVTPWLSDRDLALQNVRYVLNAAGNLHEDFRAGARTASSPQPRPPGAGRGDRPARADRRRAGTAAARGDRRRHVRPDEAPGRRGPGPRRRGRRRPGLLQPRDRDPGGRSDRPSADGDRAAVRRHHRRRHGAAVASRCRCRTTRWPRARPLQLANKMGMDPAMVVHAKPMGDGLHLLRRLRPGAPPRRPRARSRSSSATTRC